MLLLGTMLMLSTWPCVQSQAKFTDSLAGLRDRLEPKKFRQLIGNYTAQFFSPYVAQDFRAGPGSTFWLLQAGLRTDAQFSTKFTRSSSFSPAPTPIDFQHFDFLEDAGPGADGDNFMAKIQRLDIAMLEAMKVRFYTTKPKTVQGFNLGRRLRPRLAGDPMVASRRHLEFLLTKVFTFPRNHRFDQGSKSSLKEHIGNYIWRKFGTLGFLTGAQSFRPGQFHNMHPGHLPPGTNMLGVLPGTSWGTAEDRVVVVAAHWDTVDGTGGLNDNGSGMAAMLELARALSHGQCANRFSIILVAVDLEEIGSQGSLVFLHDFLIPKVLRPLGFPKPQFSGAIIMDSILNFNSSLGSQDVGEGWSHLMPGAAASITGRGGVGDFLAVYNRATPGDAALRGIFMDRWAANGGERRGFRVEDFRMAGLTETPDLPQLVDHVNLLRSDHSRFWVGSHKEYFASLPAIVLTDTGPARGRMRQCYHAACDIYNPKEKGSINWRFLGQTVQTLIDTVVSLSHAACRTRRRVTFNKASPPKYVFKEGEHWPGLGGEDTTHDRITTATTTTELTTSAATVWPDFVHMPTVKFDFGATRPPAQKYEEQRPTHHKKESLSPDNQIWQTVKSEVKVENDHKKDTQVGQQRVTTDYRSKARLNDKDDSGFPAMAGNSLSLLAYTGTPTNLLLKGLSRSPAGNKLPETSAVLRYEVRAPPSGRPPLHTHNTFHPATQPDNPYFTWVALPRSTFHRMSPLCTPFCHLRSLLGSTGRRSRLARWH